MPHNYPERGDRAKKSKAKSKKKTRGVSGTGSGGKNPAKERTRNY